MLRFSRAANGYFLSPTCTRVGEVTIGADSSIWCGAVVRGDVAPVTIGARVNVQDGAIIHCDTGVPNVIDEDVSIGHGAICHGEFVGRGTLIGMRATLLGRTRIGSECLIAAGAVVPPGMHVPDRMVAMGIPAKIVRAVSEDELKYMRWLPQRYRELAHIYASKGFPDHANMSHLRSGPTME
jgi:carbonic anhydrase/acetyltransferase-like protein (isoleucine patch superfamily)